MADVRSRRPGEQPQIAKLVADAAAMREQIDGLEGRVLRLEAEIAAGRAKPVKSTPAGALPQAPPRPASKRPAPVGPPPLPPMSPAMPAIPKSGGRRSVVDISEIAELVESIPPPEPRSRK